MFTYIMIIKLLLIYFNYHVICTVTEKTDTANQQFYRISMVSSHETPGNPALFLHGQSPTWDPEHQSLYFVDANDSKVYRLDYVSGKITSKKIDYGEVNLVSLVADSSRLLVAVRSSLFLLDWSVHGDAALRLLTTVDLGMPDNVINEGKTDPEGRFWIGTRGPQINDEFVADKGTLYTIDQENLSYPRVKLRPATSTNGLVWSLNKTVMYFIDSATQKVEAFDFDLSKGDISNRRTIIDVSNYGYEDAVPGGMTIDDNGNLWVALMFGGTVLHVDPDTKQVIFGYKLPVSRVSSVCWGGPRLDELFVTTVRDTATTDAVLEPLGGAIFTIRGTGSQGVMPLMFRLENADTF